MSFLSFPFPFIVCVPSCFSCFSSYVFYSCHPQQLVLPRATVAVLAYSGSADLYCFIIVGFRLLAFGFTAINRVSAETAAGPVRCLAS